MARPLKSAARSELKNTSYEIFIGILSVLSILNLVLVYAFQGDEALQQVLAVMNGIFSAIFLGDFIFRMATAESAARYFFRGFGWADLLASLPFPQLKILRIFRLLRVYRLMSDVGPGKVWSRFIHDRANSTLMTLLLLGIFVLQFGSLGVLWVEENAEGSNITSASDALWYTIVTISTVGYGDQYPVTNAGRFIGTFIIVVGVGIFGTFTGYLANLFLGPGRSEAAAEPAPDAGAAPIAASPSPDAVTRDATAPDAGADAAEKRSHPLRPSPEHTATGLAAGSAAGAVAAGASAGAGAGDAASTPPAPTDAHAAPTEARLRELLRQSEEMARELRALVDAGR